MENKRRYQIGVMGSAADLNYSHDLEKLAFEIGKEIAASGNIILYGAEKDVGSLSTAAARGAKSEGGLTIGITYGRGKEIWDVHGATDAVIVTGLERGGGREFVLVNSCDALVVISGGSGTLTEMVIAYQLDIPTVVLSQTGGWADKLSGEYFDARKRRIVEAAATPREAVLKALKLILKKIELKKEVRRNTSSCT